MTTAKEKTEAVAVAKIEKNIADSVLERVNSFKETKQKRDCRCFRKDCHSRNLRPNSLCR